MLFGVVAEDVLAIGVRYKGAATIKNDGAEVMSLVRTEKGRTMTVVDS